jgi:hypothetical protein
MRPRYVIALVAFVILLGGSTAIVLFTGHSSRPQSPPDLNVERDPSVAPAPFTSRARAKLPPSDPRYAQAIDTAAGLGMRVWIDTDLVKYWISGKSSWSSVVKRVATLAKHRGVAGIKIADEVGYHDGLDTPAKINGFLTDAAKALRAAAPGKKIAIDMYLPELGCLPGSTLNDPQQCTANARDHFPQLRLDQVDRYVASRTFDQIQLSSALMDPRTYAGWGTSVDAAQQAAWTEIERRGWPKHVTVVARRGLAHPGRYSKSAAAAEQDTHVFVDVPRSLGDTQVDIWAWRQQYHGSVWRLMDPGMRPNPLWIALKARHDDGVPMYTHFTPSSVETNVAGDLRTVATVFTDVIIAAGTG